MTSQEATPLTDSHSAADGRATHPHVMGTSPNEPMEADEHQSDSDLTIGQFLRSEMLPGESQRAFARRLRLPERTLSSVLSRQHPPSDKTITALRAIFGDALPSMQRESLGLLTTDEAAAILSVSPHALRIWSKQGKIPWVRVESRGVRYRRSDVIAMRDQRALKEATSSSRGPTAFRAALQTALERSGLTVRAAAKAIGVTEHAVHAWKNGRRKPFRDLLERLAETVDEPSLTDLIESQIRVIDQHRVIRMVCHVCETVRVALPREVRFFEKDRAPGRITVDWEKGEALHICTRCATRAIAKAGIQRVIKRKGHRGLQSRAKPLAIWREKHPELVTELARETARSRRHPQYTERSKARMRLGKLALEPKGTITLCTVCHRLLFMPDAHIRGRQVSAKFHTPCLREWRSSQAMRDWSAAMNEARRSGEQIPPVPVPTPSAHRPTTAESLTEGYATTLRYFWQRERSRRAERDEHGQVRSVTWLANTLGIGRRTLHQRVERFLSLLPDETIATGAPKVWRDVFLALLNDDIDQT